ncbi:hypothetical protein GA0070616_3746 [Micromonospora nigra]|uniref:Uncharacterized protein n=1 Tax=Micromonospora nigra TaxID=145857 RepID=A0A1C6SH01_9ACTN|nr:hypothetical protein [Micromonospora nigra]SCL28713.1 hypothetical protein GA0070616_3746 [Micromonospora nigra]
MGLGDGPADEFEEYVQDATVSAALRDWAAGLGVTVSPPSRTARRRGRSDADLVPVIVERHDGRDAAQLYVKVLPSREAARETARHAAARDVDPGFAERHLVRQPYPRHPVGDGRYLMFQDIAHGAEQVVPLAEVEDEQLIDAYRTVLDRIQSGWHRQGRRRRRTTVGEFVRRELTDAGALVDVRESVRALGLRDLDADWLVDEATGTVVPNPLRLPEPHSPFHDDPLDQLCAVSHGDLHSRNVLFPCSRRGRVEVTKFCLVDTDRFATDAPLTRDLVSLMLDAVLPDIAAGMTTVQADALRALLIDPAERASDRLPPLPAGVIRSCYQVGLAAASEGNWRGEWRAQYLLSLASQALICCTYDDAGPAGRAWYFRLAAHAAEAYRREFRPTVVPPPAESLPAVPSVGSAGATRPSRTRNDPSVRFEGTGPQPSQQNRGGPLDRARPEQAKQSVDIGLPPWPFDPVIISDGGVPAWWHEVTTSSSARPAEEGNTPRFHEGAAPTGNAPGAVTGDLPGTATGNAAGADRVGGTGRSTVRGGKRRGIRSEPRHAVARSPQAIPRPRQPVEGESLPGTPPPPQTRLAPRLRVLLVILLGGASLASLVTVGTATVRDRGEEPAPPATGAPPGVTPPSATPGGSDAPARLADLALMVAGLRPTPVAGTYTVVCRRIWSPNDLAPGIDPARYRDEQLWWSARLSGRRVVTPVVKGRRSSGPTMSRYRQGDLTEIPSLPSADPAELREQLAAQLGELPPELRSTAGMLHLVSRLFRYHLLDPGQRSALLYELAATPGIRYRGAYPDRADRPGLAFSADDSQGRRETLLFDPASGELLSHETTSVTGEQTLGYQLFLTRTRTDTTDGPRCA